MESPDDADDVIRTTLDAPLARLPPYMVAEAADGWPYRLSIIPTALASERSLRNSPGSIE